MTRLVSWPVARATLSTRLRSPAPWLVGALFAITAAVRGSRHGAGIETFSGPAEIWFVVLTFGMGSAILSEEMESGHAQLVLLRPITRAAWYGGRFTGAWLSLGILCATAWAATLAVAVSRGDGFDPRRLAALGLGLLWGGAWLSVLTCLGTFLRGWTNAGALGVVTLGWILLLGAVGAIRSDWLGLMKTVTEYLGPQDPMVLVDPTRSRLDFGPALYDLIWVFVPWFVGVVVFNRRELARRRT